MTPEEYERRVRICLAEVGYHDARIWIDGQGLLRNGGNLIPDALWWMACHLANPPLARACWTCWEESQRKLKDWRLPDSSWALCRQGDCQHPEGPKTPPRELLLDRRVA